MKAKSLILFVVLALTVFVAIASAESTRSDKDLIEHAQHHVLPWIVSPVIGEEIMLGYDKEDTGLILFTFVLSGPAESVEAWWARDEMDLKREKGTVGIKILDLDGRSDVYAYLLVINTREIPAEKFSVYYGCNALISGYPNFREVHIDRTKNEATYSVMTNSRLRAEFETFTSTLAH